MNLENRNLIALVLKLVAAAAALAGCICAVAYYWEVIRTQFETSRKLYCHERMVRGHEFGRPKRWKDYLDMCDEMVGD